MDGDIDLACSQAALYVFDEDAFAAEGLQRDVLPAVALGLDDAGLDLGVGLDAL